MIKQFTIIRFTQVGRGAARGMTRHVWVKDCRFKDDGPGFKVKSIGFTTDREKAARFSLVAATEIASQYYTSPATLERPDGTPMPEETKTLQAECFRRHEQAIQNRAAIRREWDKALNEISPAARKMIDPLLRKLL